MHTQFTLVIEYENNNIVSYMKIRLALITNNNKICLNIIYFIIKLKAKNT
jgi:hypothetical protein